MRFPAFLVFSMIALVGALILLLLVVTEAPTHHLTGIAWCAVAGGLGTVGCGVGWRMPSRPLLLASIVGPSAMLLWGMSRMMDAPDAALVGAICAGVGGSWLGLGAWMMLIVLVEVAWEMTDASTRRRAARSEVCRREATGS